MANAITLTKPKNHGGFQRVVGGSGTIPGGNSGPIIANGTYSGLTSIEYSIDGGSNWGLLADASHGTFSGGNWSNTLTNVPQGQYSFIIRGGNDNSTFTSIANLKIGEVVLVWGQSNPQGQLGQNQSYVGNNGLTVGNYGGANPGAWGDAIDPLQALGSPSLLLATRIIWDQSVPVMLISQAQAGQTIYKAPASLQYPSGTYYQLMKTEALASGVNAIGSCFWWQGESDYGTATRAQYLAAMITQQTGLLADLPGTPQLIPVCPGGVGWTGSPNIGDIKFAIADFRDLYGIGGGWLGYEDDEIHPQDAINNPDTIALKIVDREFLALANWRGWRNDGCGRGPAARIARRNAAKTQTTVYFDRPLRTGQTARTQLWAVSDGGGSRAVSAVGYHAADPNALVVTHAAIAGTGPGVTCGCADNTVQNADASAVHQTTHSGGASPGWSGSGLGAPQGQVVAISGPGGAWPTTAYQMAEPFQALPILPQSTLSMMGCG